MRSFFLLPSVGFNLPLTLFELHCQGVDIAALMPLDLLGLLAAWILNIGISREHLRLVLLAKSRAALYFGILVHMQVSLCVSCHLFGNAVHNFFQFLSHYLKIIELESLLVFNVLDVVLKSLKFITVLN